jgi:predicted solute-binding protein
LPAAARVDFDTLKASFLSRFQPRKLEKYCFATELFKDMKGETQTVDDYLTNLRYKASIAGINPQLLTFVCISGLKPEIKSYVLEHKP